jgi:tetratricopeptide (TPR) repeat protein
MRGLIVVLTNRPMASGPTTASFRRATLALLLAIIAGCASGPTPVPPEDPAAREGSGRAPTPAVIEVPPDPVANSAVDDLLEEARRFRERGELSASYARLERALRIAPERAEVYLELARNHAAAGRSAQAAAAAERGLLYCSGATCSRLRALIKT